MNNTEALKRIAELQKQLDELKASLEKKEDALWVPKLHANYWTIDDYGDVSFRTSRDYDYTSAAIQFGNCFQTKEQAERHAKRLKLYNKLWKLAEYLNGDWVPDYSNGIQDSKHRIDYDYDDEMFTIQVHYSYSSMTPVFKSHAVAERAISMLTDEEKEIFKNMYRP